MDDHTELPPPPRNYFPTAMDSPGGFKYRLDGREVIREIVETLKGGVKFRKGQSIDYHEGRRLMNDLGIERVRLMVQTGVNKVNHLTKYSNENRIFSQMKAIMRAFIYELVLNAKKWAPPDQYKVRNMRLIIQMVENAIYQSMLRGTEGFEAQLTAKSWGVQEVMDHRIPQKSGGGIFSLFRRSPPQQPGGYYG